MHGPNKVCISNGLHCKKIGRRKIRHVGRIREVLKARDCSNEKVEELQVSLSREEGRDKEIGDVEVEWSPFKNMLVKVHQFKFNLFCVQCFQRTTYMKIRKSTHLFFAEPHRIPLYFASSGS